MFLNKRHLLLFPLKPHIIAFRSTYIRILSFHTFDKKISKAYAVDKLGLLIQRDWQTEKIFSKISMEVNFVQFRLLTQLLKVININVQGCKYKDTSMFFTLRQTST